MAITSITPECIVFSDGEEVARLSLSEAARIPSAAEFVGLGVEQVQALKAGGAVAPSSSCRRRLVQLADVLLRAYPDDPCWDVFLADTAEVA